MMPSPSQRYPFSAVVGHDDYKLALLASAVDPAIGGVLALGERGTAKSTLAHAFSALLPDHELRVVDEINLLDQRFVDSLFESSESAHHLIAATMNPADGKLSAHLLDRFGLSVLVQSTSRLDERAEIVQRRITFEQYPSEFCERFAATEDALRSIIARARRVMLEVDLPDQSLALISKACAQLDLEGMRGELAVARTATALAALDDRRLVIDRDIETAARLALGHRGRSLGNRSSRLSGEEIDAAFSVAREDGLGHSEQKAPKLPFPRTAAAMRQGQSEETIEPAPGFMPGGLDVIATARAAVSRRIFGGSAPDLTAELGGPGSDVMQSQPGAIGAKDLRDPTRTARDETLVLCVVDASSSVLAGGRRGDLRALLGGLTSDSRRGRDRVGLVGFSGQQAKLITPPSSNHAMVLAGLDALGQQRGASLADGIHLAHEIVTRELRRNPRLRPIVALVTDGPVGEDKSDEAIGAARAAARSLKGDGVTLVVIGETSSGSKGFANSSGAEFYPFDPPGTREAA